MDRRLIGLSTPAVLRVPPLNGNHSKEKEPDPPDEESPQDPKYEIGEGPGLVIYVFLRVSQPMQQHPVSFQFETK